MREFTEDMKKWAASATKTRQWEFTSSQILTATGSRSCQSISRRDEIEKDHAVIRKNGYTWSFLL
jgi:hypothetical protein